MLRQGGHLLWLVTFLLFLSRQQEQWHLLASVGGMIGGPVAGREALGLLPLLRRLQR